MQKNFIEITLNEIRIKTENPLNLKLQFSNQFKKNEFLYTFFQYKEQNRVKEILEDLSLNFNNLEEIELIFTGVGLEIYPQIKKYITKRFKKYQFQNYLDLTIQSYIKQIELNKKIFTYEVIRVDKFIDRELVKEKIQQKQLLEKIEYPFILIDTRKNCQIFKINQNGEKELLGEGMIGEVSLISFIYFLEQNQNMKFISIDDLMKNYLSYDVDITVGDIYGNNFESLWKDLIASSMGKNDGKNIKSFLKSLLFTTAINASNLCAILDKKIDKPKINVIFQLDFAKHNFCEFFFCSLISFYSNLYGQQQLIASFLEEEIFPCLEQLT